MVTNQMLQDVDQIPQAERDAVLRESQQHLEAQIKEQQTPFWQKWNPTKYGTKGNDYLNYWYGYVLMGIFFTMAACKSRFFAYLVGVPLPILLTILAVFEIINIIAAFNQIRSKEPQKPDHVSPSSEALSSLAMILGCTFLALKDAFGILPLFAPIAMPILFTIAFSFKIISSVKEIINAPDKGVKITAWLNFGYNILALLAICSALLLPVFSTAISPIAIGVVLGLLGILQIFPTYVLPLIKDHFATKYSSYCCPTPTSASTSGYAPRVNQNLNAKVHAITPSPPAPSPSDGGLVSSGRIPQLL